MATSTLNNTSLTWTSDGTAVLAALTASAGKLKLTGGVLQGASLAVACASNDIMRMMTSSSTAGEFIATDASPDTIEHASSANGQITALNAKFDSAGAAAWNVVGARVLIRTAAASNANGGAEATNHPMNGIYKVTRAAVDGSATWMAERAADFSVGGASGDVFAGNAYLVNAGTVHGRTTLVVSDNWTGDALYPAAIGFYNGVSGSGLSNEAANFISFAPAKASVIADGIVTTNSLASGFEVTNDHIPNNEIELSKFAAFNNIVPACETVANGDLLPIYDISESQVRYITRENLVDGIGGSLPEGTTDQFLVYASNGTTVDNVTMSGDATLAASGALTLAADQPNVETLGHASLVLGDAARRIDLSAAGKIQFGNATDADYVYVDLSSGNQGKLYGTSFNTTSDVRAKRDMQPIEDASAKLLSLPAFTFEYNGLCSRPEGFKSAGTSAQAVRAVLPCAVSEDPKGYLSVAYDCLHALYIASAHEQIAKVDVLEARIEALEALLLLRADRHADEPDVEAKQGGGGGSK